MELVDEYEDESPQDNPAPEQQATVEAKQHEETKDTPPFTKTDTPTQFGDKVPDSLANEKAEIKQQSLDA